MSILLPSELDIKSVEFYTRSRKETKNYNIRIWFSSDPIVHGFARSVTDHFLKFVSDQTGYQYQAQNATHDAHQDWLSSYRIRKIPSDAEDEEKLWKYPRFDIDVNPLRRKKGHSMKISQSGGYSYEQELEILKTFYDALRA